MGSTEIARSAPSATTGVRAGTSGARRVELPVSGLTCHNCVQAVERALRAVPGVRTATVNLAEGRAVVEYDPEQTGLPALREAVKAAGYRSDTARARFTIRGITCASCVTMIEKALLGTPGVLKASVTMGTGEADGWSLPSVPDFGAVKAGAGSAGYGVREAPPPASPEAADREAEARGAGDGGPMRE